MPAELQLITPATRRIPLKPERNPYFIGSDKDGDLRIVATTHAGQLQGSYIRITDTPDTGTWSLTTLPSTDTRVYIKKDEGNEDRLLPNKTVSLTPGTTVTIARDVLSFQLLNQLQKE